MTELLATLQTGGVWVCAACLWVMRTEIKTMAAGFLNHERRIKRLERLHHERIHQAAA